MKKVSRRNFMKLGLSTALAGAAITPQPEANAMGHLGAPVPAAPLLRSVRSFCPFCQVRCTYDAYIEGNRIQYLIGTKDNQWTGGGMCPKGMSIPELASSPHRLTTPLLRKGNSWQSIEYNTAIDLIVEKLKQAKEKRGSAIERHLALTAPLWDCRESEIAALMTMRLAGCTNIMPSGEVCISTASNVLSTLLGSGNSTTTVDEVMHADTLILWGANLTETYPVYSRWLSAGKENGVKIIYIDCRKTHTSNWCDFQYFPKPGTDGALAMGAINWLISKNAIDHDFLNEKTINFESLRQSVVNWDINATSSATGMTPEHIVDFYTRLEKSGRTMLWMGGSLSRYSNGMPTIRALIALQAIRSNLIGSGCGLLSMESGKPEGEKEFVDKMCGEASGTGVNFRRLLNSMNKGDIDVLFLNSSYRRYPDSNGVKKALEKVGFVVHRGFFKTEELEVTDLFMPATFSPESQGSHYGAEKQVVWREKCIDAPGACVPDWQFYKDIGKKLAPEIYPEFENPAELFNIFKNTVADWHGISLERLRESPGGLIGPLRDINEPQKLGCIYREGNFLTADGKTDFAPKLMGPLIWQLPKGHPEGREKNPDYPLILIQGKNVTQWQQTLTNFAASLAQFAEGRFVLIHPDTAESLKLTDGEAVYLETAFGKLPAWAKVSSEIIPNVAFTLSHYTASSPYSSTKSEPINSILPSYWDRISAQFNGLGCKLSKRQTETEG